MAISYAVTRKMDPGTGDAAMSGVTWARGQPMTECVIRILRTQRGSYRPDPTMGVDYTAVQKAAPNAAATWRAEVLRALSPLIIRGLITNVAVTVDTTATGRLLYAVDFYDPRAATRLTTGRLAL